MAKKLYSDTFSDQGVRDLIRRIGAANDSTIGFVSQPYMFSASKGQQGICEWIEAQKNRSGQGWRLTKNTQFVNKDGTSQENDEAICQTQTIISNVCFFDALHYCMSEQNYREMQKSSPVNPEDISLDIMDGLADEIAEKSYQPKGLDNLPLPAVDGRIIVDGTYSVAAKKLAQKTKGTSLLPQVSQSDYLNRQVNMLPKAINDEVMKAGIEEQSNQLTQIHNVVEQERMLELNAKTTLRAKQLVTGSYHKMQGKGRTLAGSFRMLDRWTDYSDPYASRDVIMDNGFFPIMGSLALTIPLIFPAAALNAPLILLGGPLAFVAAKLDATFTRDLHYMKRSVQKLPNSEYKTMMVDFTNAVEVNTYLGAASHIANSGKTLSKRQVKKGLRYIDRASDIAQFSDVEKGKLEQAFLSQNFPERESFEKKLKNIFNTMVDERDRIATHVLENSGASDEKAKNLINNWPKKIERQRWF